MDKARNVNWYDNNRKEYYAVISRAGFTQKARSFAKDKGVLLFDLDDIEKIMG